MSTLTERLRRDAHLRATNAVTAYSHSQLSPSLYHPAVSENSNRNSARPAGVSRSPYTPHNDHSMIASMASVSLQESSFGYRPDLRFTDSERDETTFPFATPNSVNSSHRSQSNARADHKHVIDHAFSTPPQTSLNDTTLAESARSEWRHYGPSHTQALEDVRRSSNEFIVRLRRAESRRDVAGSEFTVYLLHVEDARSDDAAWTVERRYSEFEKLFQQVCHPTDSCVDSFISSFPSKHWAGRLGPWTPSRIWAPAQYAALIQDRLVQLDAWLVHVVHAHCTSAAVPSSVQRDAVVAFLTVRDAPPPSGRLVHDPSVHTSLGTTLQWHNPLTFTLGSALRQATATVTCMCRIPTNDATAGSSIPIDLLQSATGLLFLTVVKAGMVVSGRVGTGLLVAKLPPHEQLACRWSAPVAVGTMGLGWGALIGGDVTHSLIILTTPQAVADFAKGSTSLCLGAEVGVSVGPSGRSAAAQTTPLSQSPYYAYALSSGFFVGVSLEGSVVRVRPDVNAKFYGRHVSVSDLMSTSGVPAAEPLYAALDAAIQCDLPETAFRPSRLWQTTLPAPNVTLDSS